MKKLPKNPIRWALLLLIALLMTLPACTSLKPSKRELQRQQYADSLTASRASKISDRQAAIAAIDMLKACECALADSTQALLLTRKKAEEDNASAQKGGIITGSLAATIVFLIISVLK